MKINRPRYYLGALGILLLLMMGTLWAVSAVASPSGQTEGTVALFRGDDAVTHVSPDTAIASGDRLVGVRVTDEDLNNNVPVGEGEPRGVSLVIRAAVDFPTVRSFFIDISLSGGTGEVDANIVGDLVTTGDVLEIIGNVSIDYDNSVGIGDAADPDVTVVATPLNATLGQVDFSVLKDLDALDVIVLSYDTSSEEGTVVEVEGDSGTMFLDLREAATQGTYEATYVVSDDVTIDVGDIREEQHEVAAGLETDTSFTETIAVSVANLVTDLQTGGEINSGDTFSVTVSNPQIRDADDDDDVDANDITVVSGNVVTTGGVIAVAGIVLLTATAEVPDGSLIRLTYDGDDSFTITLEHGPAFGDIFAGAVPVVGAAFNVFVSVPQPGTASDLYQLNGYDAAAGTMTFGVLSNTPEDGTVLGVDYTGTQEILVQQPRTGDELFEVTLSNALGGAPVVTDVVVIAGAVTVNAITADSTEVQLKVNAGAQLEQGDSINLGHPNMVISADFNPDGALNSASAQRPIVKAESIGSVTATYTDADFGPILPPALVIVEDEDPDIEGETPDSGSATGVAAGTVLSINVNDLPPGTNGSGVDAGSIRFLLTTRDAASTADDVKPGGINAATDFIVTADTSTDGLEVTASLPLDDPDQRLVDLDLNQAVVNLKWWVQASDNVGNTDTSDEDDDSDNGNQPFTLAIDTVPPELDADNSYTGDWFNPEGDGAIEGDRPELDGSARNNSIRVAFTDDLDPATVQASDFVVTVDGVELAIASAAFEDGSVFLTMVNDLAADATPIVELVGEVTDEAGNPAIEGEITVQDGIAPDVQITTSTTLSQDEVIITVTTDEDIVGDPNLRLFIRTPNATGDPTDAGIDIPTPQRGANVWTYEFDFENGPDNQYSAQATAVDDIRKPRNVGTGGTQDPSDDGAVTFQIDRRLPGPDAADFDPGTGDEINFAPLLFFEFNWNTEGGEYSGDSHDNVALTTLVLDSGDAGEVDLLGDVLPQAADTSFELSMANLSVGTHTLSVNGTDDAGNPITNELGVVQPDFLVEFEVTRPIFELVLGRGISHISLPRDAIDGDINAVFGGSSQVLTVFTFEGNRPLAAFRDPITGEFVGNLDTIDSEHAYGVETDGPVTVEIQIPPLGGNRSLPTVGVTGGDWNFVSVISLDDLEDIPQGTELDADTYLGGNWSSGWTFQQGGWQAILPNGNIANSGDDVQDTGEVWIGRGYWVFFTADGNLNPGTTQ